MATLLPHVVLFPFPTQGHINPLMLLAEHLLSAGIQVTFIHTARSYAMLQKKRKNTDAGNHHKLLSFEVLPDAVPVYDEENMPVSPSVRLFIESIPMMRQKLEELMQRLMAAGQEENEHENAAGRGGPKPCCLISDSFLPWTQDVARLFDIPRIEFSTVAVTGYAMGQFIPELIHHGYLPVHPDADQEALIDIIPGLSSLRLADLVYDLTFHPISSPIFQFLRDAFTRGKEAQRVIAHSFYDLEKIVIDAMRAEGLPIDPIGPLLFPIADKSFERSTSASLLSEDLGCLEWLDQQPNSSVIYASFGSNVVISGDEVQELALGLEDCQQPFLMVVRPDLAVEGSTSKVLIEDFKLRFKGKGYLTSWAPQSAVLAHRAVGGFLSHCGWNSSLEAIWMGVPVIGCPRESEQNVNLKCLREWNVAIALDTGKGHVTIKRDLVVKAVRTLMQEEAGRCIRKSMLELKEAARHAMEKGQSRENLNKLVEDIRQMSLGERPSFLPPAT